MKVKSTSIISFLVMCLLYVSATHALYGQQIRLTDLTLFNIATESHPPKSDLAVKIPFKILYSSVQQHNAINGDNEGSEYYKNLLDFVMRFGLFLLVAAALFAHWVSNGFRKAGESQEMLIAKLYEVDAEKFKLELESLRAQYFDHAIRGVFKYLRILIDEGRMYGDKNKLESAISVTNKLSRLFYNISKNSGGDTLLLDEIENGRQYVDLMCDCAEHIIDWQVVGIEYCNISIPSFSLLDFYINAINHGGLLEKEGAFIKTSVWKEEGFLYLEIEDNGIALSKDGLPNSRISTGHDRVSKRFELFNRQNSNIKLSFDKTKDFRKLFDKKGNPCGAKAIIKIAYNDKS